MLSIIIEWALQPLGLVTCSLLLTLLVWVLYGAKPRLPFTFFCTSSLMLIVFSMPSVANRLVWHFENARSNPTECSNLEPRQLVVLGGGIDLYVPSNSPYEQLNSDSLIRTLRAIQFANDNTHYYLLGGGNTERTVAGAMQQVLLAHNVQLKKITIETQSKSTHENAIAFNGIVPPAQAPRIHLLTSQLHVNRAAATFEKNGYQVCHIGVDTRYSIPKAPVSLLPYLSGLNKTTLVIHEWMALNVYRLKGYL